MKDTFTKPLISIIIPVFRVEEYINRCLESVLNQTYSNLEIILVDDGSPDRCPQICDDYAKIDERVVVIHQENKGLSGARNAGIAVAHGEYISFIDSDDYIQSIYIEQLYSTLTNSGKRLVACSYSNKEELLNDELVDNFEVYSAENAIKEILLERAFQPSAWGKLYDRELFSQVLFPEGKIFEDYATAPLFFHLADGLAYCKSKLYYYTYNDESITKSSFNKKQLQYFEIANNINDFLREYYPQLLKHALRRDENVAISYFKKMCEDGYSSKDDIDYTIKKIKSGLREYLWSSYSLKKKMAAVLIAFSPQLAFRVFAKK